MAPKKRGSTVADRIAARAQSSVMDSTGTGDASMDKLLKRETNRKAAFASTTGTTARGAAKGESAISAAFRRIFGSGKKKP